VGLKRAERKFIMHDDEERKFTWDKARAALTGAARPSVMNIGWLTADRHVAQSDGDRVALRATGARGAPADLTYAELAHLSDRFAGVLRALGVGAGDPVFTLLGQTLELFVAALGVWKAGAVFCPLFSAFGPKPISDRLARGAGKVLITTGRLYAQKIKALRDAVPAVKHVIVTADEQPAPEGVVDYAAALAAAPDAFECAPTRPGDPAILHFTSGTTGAPKGVLHVHDAAVVHHATARRFFGLKPGDVYWCNADPGWVTGISYGVIAPLLCGAMVVLDDSPFDAEHWLDILECERVAAWYASPTGLRMLRRVLEGDARERAFPALRVLASVGEPLSADVALWARSRFGAPVLDTWWQTETGGIMIAGTADNGAPLGSMGRAMTGVEAALARPGGAGGLELIDETEAEGELVLHAGWPSMFRAYLGEEARYEACFKDGWYLSGDLARRDAEGYYWFVARRDDVIKSAGRLIGPVEVENALLEHPSVRDAAVVGLADPIAGEVIVAFVALAPDASADEEAKAEILAHARRRLGPALAPKEIIVRAEIPRTLSGKIMRRLLKDESSVLARDAARQESETHD
jgi:acetyl-CoA synthetase